MTGSVVIVTGASRGIGRAAAIKALTVFDANVVAVARDLSALKKLQEQISKDFDKGENIQIVSGDLTDPVVAKKAVDTAISTWGKLDSVIANAGLIEPIASIADGSVDEWKKLFDINVFSVISLAQAAIPFLRKSDKGSIIIVSSGAALKGYKGWGAYGASKAAVNHITSTLAAEEENIASIAIRPGVVDTDMQVSIRNSGKEAMGSDHGKFTQLHSEGKLTKPEQPGYVLAALANNASKKLSGLMYTWNDEQLADYQDK